MLRSGFCALLVGLVAHCASAIGLPPAPQPGFGALMLAVQVSPPLSPFGSLDRACDFAYFLRETGLPPTPEDYFQSYIKIEDRLYIPELPVGVYLPVACSYSVTADLSDINRFTERYGIRLPPESHYTTFFSQELAQQARSEVVAGRLSIIGPYRVDMSLDFSTADDFQRTNRYMLRPDQHSFGLSAYAQLKFLYRGALLEEGGPLRAQAARDSLLHAVREDLRNTDWAPLLSTAPP